MLILIQQRVKVFSSGILKDELDGIQAVTGIKIGKLRVRYLGVPLVIEGLLQLILLNAVFQRINQLCSRFLSEGKDEPVKGGRHIKAILTKQGSLWIAWLYASVTKDCFFWQLQGTKGGSWTWRKILKMRSVAITALKLPIDAGITVSRYWKEIRKKKEKVLWDRLVSWMAILDRLLTKEKLISY
ncbi:hypothetical protein J1N35_021548 [Gossypium stocksii]|uniref:Reverse transcriptase zinc-binding domain-containing protein n=1 Tax=Gossypium stocksii TaxID=47602 RepID=A0A9D4A1Y4_9ROSI|nr:hypothetical protein J1N35_021548 [Gossypium stocksii]